MLMRLRSRLVGALVFAVHVGCCLAFAQEQTLQGELVDPALYLKEGRHGPLVAEETYEAVDGGQTLCLLEDGTELVYLLLAGAPGDDPSELAYDSVGKKVKITGALYERGGLHGLVATSIEPLEPSGLQAPASSDTIP